MSRVADCDGASDGHAAGVADAQSPIGDAQAFRGQGSGKMHHQWALFLTTNLLGFTLNRGTYALLVTFVALCAAQPVFATAAGAVAGMFLNFRMSRTVVFR